MVPLSILDLVRVTEDTDARGALDNARDLAAHAETLGLSPHLGRRASQHAGHRQRRDFDRHRPYRRRDRRPSASARAASCCPIMRRSSSPSSSARWRALFPGRIDLGLGRAPGTDQLTVRALRRVARGRRELSRRTCSSCRPTSRPAQPGQRVQAVPAAGTEGAALDPRIEHFGAHARRGARPALRLRFAFRARLCCRRSKIYRSRFKPSEQLARPTRWSASTSSPPRPTVRRGGWRRRSRCRSPNIFRGARGLSRRPIDDIEAYWPPREKAQVLQMLARSIVGSPETVRAGIDALIDETAADEIMIVSDVYNHNARLRSFELIAAVHETSGIERMSTETCP